MLIFAEGEKTGEPGEKNPRGMVENNTSNKLNSHMIRMPEPGLEPGPQRRKAGALTTRPTMPPGLHGNR